MATESTIFFFLPDLLSCILLEMK